MIKRISRTGITEIQDKRKDNLNKLCQQCKVKGNKRGRYIETSIFDDRDGVLHCSKCRQQINRWEPTEK